MRTDVGVVITDTHILASTGLLPPEATADDGAPLRPNKAQSWLWRKWTETLARATTELLPTEGGQRFFIHLGDIQEGAHHDTTQIASLNMATMRRISAQTLKPWVCWSDYTFFLRGTGAHSGSAGADEESIAEALDAACPGKIQKDAMTGLCTAFHRAVRIQSAVLDLAHHPPAGTSRPYLSHGPAGTLAVMVADDYAATSDPVPTVAFRGHLHPRRRILDSGYTYAVRGIICPCWKLIDEFGSKRTPGSLNAIGAVFFTVQGAGVNLWPVTYTPTRGKPWTEPKDTSR